MKEKGVRLFIAFCTAPAIALFGVFYVLPLLQAFPMAMYRWSGLTPKKEFIGLENFAVILNDDVYWISLKNNLVFLLTVPLVSIVIGLTIAVFLTRFKLKEKNLYRSLVYFPNVISVVAVAVIWQMVFNPSMGILNSFLRGIGLEALTKAWLGDPDVALPAVAAVMIWHTVGLQIILFMAGIESIPQQLYEAAVIDGAGETAQFFKVTLPLVWEIVRVNLILQISATFYGVFNYVIIMTNGGPDRATQVVTNYFYSQAFTNNNMGYATAVGVTIFIIGGALSVIAQKITKKESIEF